MSGTKKIILLVLAAALIAWIVKNSNGAVSISTLRTAKVQKADLSEFIKLRGKMELETRATIFSQLAGVVNFSIREGDAVKKGMKIAAIEPTDLNLALKKAAAAHQTALANLMEIKNSVKIEQIKQAEEQLAQARIALASSLNDYNYKKDLYKKMIELTRSGSISEQNRKDTKNQYDAAENLFLESERRVKIAEYNLALLKKGSSEHLIKAAEASVEQAGAAVDEIAHNIEKASIASPIDGIILSKNFEPGSFVQPGALLFEIGDTSSTHIRADVLTDDIAKIAIGRTAYIAGDILAKDSIEAKVSYIAPKAFTKVSSLGVEQQKIEVRLKYDKAGHDFRPGYEFDVNIVSRNKKNALYVPYKAVFEFDGRASMFLIENERLVLREAVTGIENDEYIEILSGAAENEIVIIDPPNSVKPGMKIKK